LTNFYQNHRRYVKSRDDPQLAGQSIGSTPSDCDPMETNDNLALYPCGLIANSFFNDTFSAYYTNNNPSDNSNNPSGSMTAGNDLWVKDGIAWKSDVDKKFVYRPLDTSKETNLSPNGFILPPVNDEDFIVWMRTAGLPTFKKLHRKIEKSGFFLLPGDSITITYNSSYPVSGFSGQKAMVLSTTSWLGGKNSFLGLAYLVVGTICIVLSGLFLLKHCFYPRKLGEAFNNQLTSSSPKQ